MLSGSKSSWEAVLVAGRARGRVLSLSCLPARWAQLKEESQGGQGSSPFPLTNAIF